MNISNIQKRYAEAVFLDYINKNSPGMASEYPSYLKDELHITDMRAFAKKLIRAGYAVQQNHHIVLTEAGEILLHKRENSVKFFELGNIYLSIQDYVAKKAKKPNKSFEIIMIELLREKVEEYRKKDDYEAVKLLHMDIAALYESISFPLQALHHYLIVLYFDVSGLEYYDLMLRYANGQEKIEKVKASFDFVYIRPEVESGIKRLKDNYDKSIIDWIYEKNKISINLCNKSHFVALVKGIMNDELSELEWQEYFKRTFRKLVDTVPVKGLSK